MFILSSICFAQDISSDKARVGVVIHLWDFISAKEVHEIKNEINNEINGKFNNPHYEYLSAPKLANSLENFCDKQIIVAPGLTFLTRNQLLDFAKEQKIDYIVIMRFNIGDRNVHDGISDYVLNLKVMAIEVSSNNLLYIDKLSDNGSGSTSVKAWIDGLPRLINKFNSQFNVEFKPVIRR